MTEELLGALKAEEESSLGFYQSQILQNQREALEQYYGQPYGDEEPDRSAVVTREVMETIEWLRPDLTRVFSATKKAAEFEPIKAQDAIYANMATEYVNWIFYEDNAGETIIDAFAFDGLLHRVGYVGVWWEEAEYSKPEKVTGLNTAQVEELTQAPDTEILEFDTEEGEPDEAHPDGLFHNMKIRERTQEGRAKIHNVAPEDMRIAARTTDLDEARYIGRIVRVTKSDLRRMFPDKTDEIDGLGVANEEEDYDERRQARFAGEEEYDNLSGGFRDAAQEIIMFEEYIRFDLDEDGHDELIAVKRVADLILESIEVEDHPFACWTPIPIPHRLMGLGMWDIMKDVQRTKTVLLRAALDATYQAVVPRMAVDMGTVNIGDLLTAKPGGVIRVRGEPRASIQPITVPDLAPSALQMMEFVDQVGESRSGVTRNAQGLDPDALNKTATGIKLMQNAASVRKEQIARNMALGLQTFMRKVYRTIVRHQDAERMMRVSSTGQFVPVDPRTWASDMKCTVHVGQGTGDREMHVAQLDRILAMQREWFANFGPTNGVVEPKHLHHTAEQIVKEMGYRSADMFFGKAENFKPPEQKGDPKVEAEQKKIQMQMQAKQAEMQLSQQKAQQDAQTAQAKLQGELELKRMSVEADIQLQREELSQKMALEREQRALELSLKREQMAAELSIKREFNLKGGTEPVRIGGDPG